MKKAQADATKILFIGIFITAFFLVATLMILGSIEGRRIDNAYIDWENEVNLLVRRFINSKNCVAFEKKEIFYSAEEDIFKFYSKTFENTIDLRKLNEQRIKDCLMYEVESSICSDCPRHIMEANAGRCPEKYCQGDYYVRKSMEDPKYDGYTYEELITPNNLNIPANLRLCPYTAPNNCETLGSGTFLELFTRPLNLVGILPCQVPAYDYVPCSSDDDGDSLYDEKLSEENKLYIYIQLYEKEEGQLKSVFILRINGDNLNKNNYIELSFPVKIRSDEYTISEGIIKFGLSVDNIYFSSRVI